MLDKEIKQNSVKIKNLIKKEIKKKVPKISEAKFDVWKIVTKSFIKEIDLVNFTAGNNAWGGNRSKITQYFHEKFFKDFKKGMSFETEGQSKKFKENIYNLLKLSVDKTPQKSDQDRTFPFKQQTKYGQEYAIPGKQTFYRNNHNPKNHYYYSYCNKTKIPFFKGPSDQEKIIKAKKWEKLFSDAFIYGYLLASVKIICDLGTTVSKKKKPSDPLSDLIIKYKKNPYTNVIYNKRYIQKIISEFYEKFYKIDYTESIKLLDNIENSIYKSKLSHFLFLKGENYYVYDLKNEYSEQYEYDGTGDFFSAIHYEKTKYTEGSKDKRFKKVISEIKRDHKKNISPNLIGSGNGTILSYEQFRFYTLSLSYQTPYNEEQLNINEKDIFIRYAINLGVQEILFYVIEQIFSPT